jgi:hypothetical protein
MHQGLTFIVHSISHDTRVARLRRADVNWITGMYRWFPNVLAGAHIKLIPHRTEVRVLRTVGFSDLCPVTFLGTSRE